MNNNSIINFAWFSIQKNTHKKHPQDHSLSKRFICYVSLLLIMPLSFNQAIAYESIGVTVTIENLSAQVSFDDLSGTDFYAKVRIDGDERHNYGTDGQQQLEGNDSIDTSLLNAGRLDWSFTKFVDPTKANIPITIKIFDEDDFLNGADDQADVENGPGTNVDITLNLSTCTFSGELSGSCGATVTTMGDGDANGNATLSFTVEIAGLNAGAGNFIHCLHDPIWPKPGETVKITAVALGDNLSPKTANEIQITFGSSTPVVQTANAFFTEFTTPALTGSDFNYSCNALNDLNNNGTIDPNTSEIATTGFRTVAIDNFPGSRAVPVLIAGQTNDDTLDVLLMPDQLTYGAPLDNLLFEREARRAIGLYYLSGIVFLENQDKLNFWLARDKGVALGSDDGCRTLPTNFTTQYTMANATLILHRDEDIRNCSRDEAAIVSTVETIDESSIIPFPGLGFGAIVHELGHALFGLSDEYCADRNGANPAGSCDGGYWQDPVNPNVFNNSDDCETQLAGEDPQAPVECQSWISENDRTSGETFWTFDPPIGDLMVDNLLPNHLDNRRIQGVFDACTGC